MNGDMSVEVKKKVFPTIGNTWVILFILLVASAIIAAVLRLFVTDISSVYVFLSYTIPFGIIAFVLVLFQKHELGVSFKSLFKRFDLQIVPYIALFVVGFGYFSDFITGLIPMPQAIRALFENLLQVSWLSFFTVCIIAPFLEELIFRGVLLRAYSINYSARKALFWSAFFFALVHFNPWQSLPAFGIGYFMGWLFLKTQSLVPAIVTHAINNGIAFLAMAISGEKAKGISEQFNWQLNIVISVVGLLLAAYSLYRIQQLVMSKKSEIK